MTDSNHFQMNLLHAYHGLIEAAEVRFEDFVGSGRSRRFFSDQPAIGPANFAAACEIISDIRLPKPHAMASVQASAPIAKTATVRLRAGVTSSCAGRDYLERVAKEAALALQLYDLFVDAARSRGIAVDIG